MKWSNISGQFTANIVKNDEFSSWSDEKSGKELPAEVQVILNNLFPFPFLSEEGQTKEIIIDFLSSGSSTPMSMYGGSDHLGWPAEYEDERILDGIDIDGKDIRDDIAEAIFEFYLDEIDEVEIDTEDYPED
jgi:hypothetical protein